MASVTLESLQTTTEVFLGSSCGNQSSIYFWFSLSSYYEK